MPPLRTPYAVPFAEKEGRLVPPSVDCLDYYGVLEVNGERVYCDGNPLKADDLLAVL